MSINASLFGHIQNDAFLSGTYKLEAHLLSKTANYLKNYLASLGHAEAVVTPKYLQLLEDMTYLVNIENSVQASVTPDKLNEHIDRLATTIHKDMEHLSPGKRLLLPGGWLDEEGGHSMVYEFIRHAEGYYFIVYNSGDGIGYHAKKSTPDRELYNPTKRWTIPLTSSKERPEEIKLFIGRLLKARLKTDDIQTSMTAKKLYQEVFPSIIYAGGEETNSIVAPFAYTAGQFSGTCSQRVLHQMLKINSTSLVEYQAFIFKFKLYALKDYCERCCSGTEPFNSAVAEQIYLAIENNLKILSSSELFSDEQTRSFFTELEELKKRINALPLPSKLKTSTKERYVYYSLYEQKLASFIINDRAYRYTPPLSLPIHFSKEKFLTQLIEYTTQIARIDNLALQYLHLERLLLALPIHIEDEFYTDVSSIEDLERFYHQIEQVQKLLHSVQKNWLKETQISKLNVLVLSALSLQTDIQNALAKQKKLPSFQSFTNQTLQSIIGNQKRNPFWATHNPQLDERFLKLQKKYAKQKLSFDNEFYAYFNELLKTEPLLNEELKQQFTKDFGSNIAELFNCLRHHQLESLYMLSLHLAGTKILDARFNPLLAKIKAHITYEGKLRTYVNPFFTTPYKEEPYITPEIMFNAFRVSTPLFPTFIPYEKLNQQLSKPHIELTSSAIKKALLSDVPTQSSYTKAIEARTANHIQLYPEPVESQFLSRAMTSEDIIARDYFHLRAVPMIQIPLTLDYFKRNIAKLADRSNRIYLEANLFQPGLLIAAVKKAGFFNQFDTFLHTGRRYFTHHESHLAESLFFIKLNFLVSQYLALTGESEGISRLQTLQQEIQKQLSSQSNPDLIYGLNYYLFLTTTAKMHLMQPPTKEDFEGALNAYLYVQSHTQSNLLEETDADKNAFDCAIANFQSILYKQNQKNSHYLMATAQKLLAANNSLVSEFTLSGDFPIYNLVNLSGKTLYTFNLMLGKLFENNLSHSGLPLQLKNHPLLQHLKLTTPQQCLSAADESYFFLIQDKKKAKIYHQNNNLTVQQYWTCDDTELLYELQALSPHHLSAYANKSIQSIINGLPRILLDGSCDYWRKLNLAHEGLLVQNNKAVYKINGDIIRLLDGQGNSTPFLLKPLRNPWAELLTRFESPQFLLHHQSSDKAYVDLPRFKLRFHRNHNTLMLNETKEVVLNCPSPIHPCVAGLVLQKESHQRLVIPIAQFYASSTGAEPSALYPVIHDTDNTIAQNYIDKNLTHLQKKPLWNYHNSQDYVSFQLKDNEPVADSSADALYLAYIYLATHQTEKAWTVLEDCRTRLGGLTGSSDELKYLSWICNELPQVLIGKEKETKKSLRKTPPYIACKLKALSLLCDSLSQEHQFKIPEPYSEPHTANFFWEKKQYDEQINFLNSLPSLIYNSFTRFQAMRRHLAESYNLSANERKHLLNHYQQAQPSKKAPLGALGYEWMLLNFETLQQEHHSLLGLKSSSLLSESDAERLKHIETQLATLHPVMAVSSTLELNEIDLSLPEDCHIKQAHLSKTEINKLNDWINNLPGNPAREELVNEAITALSSSISEGKLITYFPVYLQIMSSGNNDKKNALLNFCTRTLIAERHIPIAKQSTNKALFANILYRVATHSVRISARAPSNFHQLTLEAKKLSPPPLSVYEVCDVYKSILATPPEILERIPKHPILPPQAFISSYVPLLQTSEKTTRLAFFVGQYKELIQKHESIHAQLIEKIDSDEEELALGEIKAGKNQLLLEQQQIKLAKTLMQDPGAWSQIQEVVNSIAPKVHSTYLDLEKKVLKLANEGPQDPKKIALWQMELAAKKRLQLNKADLYSLYIKGNLNFTCSKTGLSLEKAQKLHALIHDSLVKGLQYQSLCKIQDAIKKTIHSGDAQDLVPGLDLLSQETVPGLESPALVLLQHEEGIILRARQVSALKTLLQRTKTGQFKETVEKIIPGGGKSKVILPIVAEQKVQGTNLVIVEVPQALLATNYVDLNRTSQRLFGKTPYRFEFNRESNCSSRRLEELYTKFIELMTSRSYMITTGESMQSLELKYIELLLEEEPHDEEWTKQIYWCDKLVNLIHQHGDAIIDEVHQSLWVKKKLNYALGDQKPIHPNIALNTIALFQFIDPHFIKTAPSLSEDYNWTPFQHEIAQKLLSEVSSPLYGFVKFAEKKYSPTAAKELFNYLTNTAKPCALIAKAPAETKAALAFFKQQINTLLPATLVRRLNTNYGASKKVHLSAIEQTLPIPYEANNVPNERSRFGNNLEAMNYAAQMLFIQGVSKQLLKEYLAQLQAIALQELFKNNQLVRIEDTPTAQGFALLWPDLGLTLNQIKLNDEAQITALHERLKNNKALILDLLQQQTLKLIPRDGSIIHSDSFNHVDLYHTVQAVSGTPSNHTTYHQRLTYDKTSSLGTDDYIIELLTQKKTAIKAQDDESLPLFINNILTHAQSLQHCRAIIDIRAAFQGIPNLTVAQELAFYIRNHQSQFSRPLKQVLYFNEQQVLCAIDVNKPNSVIFLKTTDSNEINRILGSTPTERFTYYDQARTLGTDLAQDEQAHGLVLVDEKTSLQAFLQGSMRMRGLRQKQSIELIVPSQLREITLPVLIKKFSKADSHILLLDNFFAVKGQMANLIRRHCLNRIQNIPSGLAKTKAAMAQAFKSFFVHSPSNDLFELYGALSKKQATKEILEQYKQQLLNSCIRILTTEGLLSEAEIKKCSLQLDELINKALIHCLPEYDSSINDLSIEVETQKEVHKATQVQVATINELFDPSLEESKPVNWKGYSLSTLYSKPDDLNQTSLLVNSLCDPAKPPLDLFSQQLRVSKSYAQTYTKQKTYLDAFMKPASLIWYHKEGSLLHAMILTPQDFEQLKEQIEKTSDSWVATTEDTLLCGTQPREMNSTNYQMLRDQARFFNGEFNSFLDPELQSDWFNELALQKLDFFEQYLLPYRPGCEKKFQEFKALLSQANMEGFIYLAEHPYDDLSLLDWSILFPEASISQAEEYKKVAAAFADIHANWQTAPPSLTNLQQRFRLPLKSLPYINTHLAQLAKLSSLLESLGKSALHLGTLLLSPNEQLLLEHYLNKPLAEFYKQYSNRIYAYIDMMEHLYTHPAIQNKEGLIKAFQRIARFTSSIEILCKLIESKNLNKELLSTILNLPQKDPLLTDKLLQLPTDLFTEEMYDSLIGRCTEAHHLQLILKRDPLTPRAIDSLLKKNLNEPQILELLSKVKDSFLLEKIYYQFRTSSAIRKSIITHPKLSATTLLEIIKAKPLLIDDELLNLLANPQAPIDEKILSTIVSNPLSTEPLLVATTKHLAANVSIIEQLLNHSLCTPHFIEKIIEAKAPNIALEIHQAIVKKAYKRAIIPSSNKEEWENCFLQSLEAIYTQSKTKLNSPNENPILFSIYSIINPFELIPYPKLAIKILKILKRDISHKLLFEYIIPYASLDELKLLVDYQFTGPLLRGNLERLYEKCSTVELINLFIKRPDLNTQLSLNLLNTPSLSEEQVQTLIKSCTSDRVLKAAFIHPQASAAVKKSVYINPNFSSSTLSFIMGKTSPNEEEMLDLLPYCHFEIDTTTLHKISQLYPTSEVIQLKLITHPKIKEFSLCSLLDSSFASPEFFLKILEHASLPISPNLLTTMAQKAFLELSLSTKKEAWEDCLLELFQHSIEIDAVESMIELIQKNWLSSKLGLKVIKIFNSRHLKQVNFPLSDMTNVAGNEELKNLLLLLHEKPLDRQDLLLLSKKCNTEELISLFLRRTDLNESLYRSILAQKEINSKHLLLILAQPNLTPLVFEAICGHPKLNKEVRKGLYNHPLKSSNSLLAILNSCPTMDEEEILFILNSLDEFINIEILQCLARDFSNNTQIWLALLSHINTDDSLTTDLLTKPLCSLPLLKSLIVQNSILLGVNKLKQITLFLIEQHRHSPLQPEIEELLFFILSLAKQHNFSKEIIPPLKTLNPISPSFGLKILPLCDHSVLDALPLFKMIDTAKSELELDELIKLPHLSKEALKKLSQKNLSAKQINQLLGRDDLSAEIADILLAKPNFNGAIQHRTWVTSRQLHYILSQSQEFVSFNSALHHPKLSSQERERWFKNVLFKQMEMEQKAAQTQNPKAKLIAAIERLKIKAFTHAMNSKTNPDYAASAKVAFELQRTLSAHTEQIIMKRTPIIKSMLLSIDEASVILAKHRGYKQILLDILNLVVVILSFGLNTSINRDWRFFKAKTDSAALLDDIKNCMKQFNPIAPTALELN
ncbi:DUF3638 domain-containing protein [Legionella sp. km772]|uniref:DUF3638 domain-containing protein n=1 Tax=Legionella sp. km772 TaxID=2498111 RepID=UPI000F8DC536|nr:DUF3638 domain-containing protein [Legionella sp. km772]RUR13896.1 DUF3638 domain-containing protein [Legionella sp. km772]